MSQEDSLYQQIGGQEKINQLIDRFYERILQDDQLAPFFVETPMDKLRAMQKEFFAVALGGPVTYSGSTLYRAHHGRGITRDHLSRYTEHLLETLTSEGIQDDQANLIVSRIATYSPEILGESGGVDG